MQTGMQTETMAKTTTEHKEGKAQVKVVYWISKTLSDGTHPFVVRVNKNKTRKHITTGLTLHPKYWNADKGEIRRNYPEPYRTELIEKLREWEVKYSTAASTLAGADQQHDAANVATKAVEGRKQTRSTSLLAYIDTIVEGMINARQTGNSIVYRDLRNQLYKFIIDEYQTTDVPFDKVTVNFCNEWENTLRATGATDNTLSNRFRTLRAVLNRAIANGFAKPDSYPFARTVADKHKFSVGKFDTTTQKRAINRDEVRKVETFLPVGVAIGAYASQKNAAEVERLTLAKNVFLFSFYVGGINFVDLAKLRWRNLTNDAEGYARLTYVRQKTGGKFSVKLLPAASAIVEQYRPLTKGQPDSYVFPILTNGQHTTETQINNRLHKILGQVNKDLKAVGQRSGVETPLTTYVARHSMANTLRQKGVATAVISQAMGHKTEAVTAIYLDSFSSETVDLAYDALL